MQTKLTLRLDRDLIEKAKRYARSTDRSVSELVANYFERLSESTTLESLSPEASQPGREEALPSIVSELHGILAGADLDEEDYRRYLQDKHR